jgi:predicted Zn-dependent protease
MNKFLSRTLVVLGTTSLMGALYAGDLEDQIRKALDPTLKRLEKGNESAPADQGKQQSQPADRSQPAQTDSGAQSSPELPAFGNISAEDERKIGSQIAGNLLGAAPLVKDAKLQKYVNKVGRWVAQQSTRPDLKWTFGVIEASDINAFAAPGGYVFITRGLYAMLKDEAELAGVLGHEIGHVQEKHHLKVLQKQQLLDVGSKLLGKQVGGNDKNVQRVIGSGAEIMARGLDKSAEFEADRIGVVLAARAGYDPWGLPGVLQEMASIAKNSSSVALLFKTHPAPEERLTNLGEAMGDRLDAIKNGRALAERFNQIKLAKGNGK